LKIPYLKSVFFYCAVLLMSWLPAGCTTFGSFSDSINNEPGYQNSPKQLLEHTELKQVFDDIAAELCTDSCPGNTRDTAAATVECDEINRQTVLVTDFVDLQSFVPNLQGLLMGELMRGSLNNRCCYRIIQAEFSRFFKLSDKGLVVLSRNINELKNDDYKQPECVVGTYSFLNNKLIIFARRINTVTGRISKMVTREIDYSYIGNKLVYKVK
jgi:hypothetical protein